MKVEPYAVSIIPISEQSSDLFTKEYRVPPGFISSSVNVGANLARPAGRELRGQRRHRQGHAGIDRWPSTGESRRPRNDFLESQGVPFPPGASANFLPQSSRLIVRNTADNLELVDAMVEQANVAGPKQVEIEAKFVEITQNNLKELGFDWLLGQFNISESKSRVRRRRHIRHGASTSIRRISFRCPRMASPVGQFPVTAGNRSGNLAISANAIDALLFGVTGAARSRREYSA